MIDIVLNQYKDLFNKYNDEELSDDLKNYIENKSKIIDIKESITIKFHGSFNEIEKEEITKVIHSTFKDKCCFYERIDRNDDLYRIILILIGSLIIAISSFFNRVINEILLIVGWVAIWEVFYDLMFNSRKRKFNKNNYQRLAKCLVKFDNE